MPTFPQTIKETGLSPAFLLDLFIKTVYLHRFETGTDVAKAMRLSPVIIDQLIESAKQNALVELLGQIGASMSAELRYQLTTKGREWATRALQQSSWTGPAPVPLEQFTPQVLEQTISNEQLTEPALRRVFSNMTLPESLMHQIGPAVNSGASILLYGPPGNGKSSIAEAVCAAFDSHVFIPHAVAVGSEIIVFFDPAVHTPVRHAEEEKANGIRRPVTFDPRYIQCVRPHAIVGGELTLEKFDLIRNPATGLYDAPLQLKAAGGLFVVDDFGRQRQPPQSLINRLIVPLEAGVDHLVLESGKKIEVPFDTLVIFATNYEPRTLMDEAGLRRLRHKILVDRPDMKTFVKILVRTARSARLELDEEVLAYILLDLYGANPNARFNAFHPRFLMDQCKSICTYRGIKPQIAPDILDKAWANLMAAH
ncbi:MAG: AAA family ATPase [Pseudomonadota bacterium]